MLKLKEAMFYPIGDTLPLDTTQHWAMAPLAPHVPADSIYRTATDFLPKARIAQLDFQTAMLNFRTAKWQLSAFFVTQRRCLYQLQPDNRRKRRRARSFPPTIQRPGG